MIIDLAAERTCCCDVLVAARRRQWSPVPRCYLSALTWCHGVTMATGHAGWRCLEACRIPAVSLLDTDAICCYRELRVDSFTSGPKSVL